MTADRMLSIVQAAEKLNCTPGRIRQICQNEKIGIKVGRDWILKPSDVQRLRSKMPIVIRRSQKDD